MPANPFAPPDDGWAGETFSPLVAQLQAAIGMTQDKLAEAWEEGARTGHGQGWSAGAKETELALRAFYEEALAEQEAAAARDLADQRAAHAADLATEVERARRDIERLTAEHAERLLSLRQELEAECERRVAAEVVRIETTVRREVEQALQQDFSARLQEAESRVRHDTGRSVRAAFEADGAMDHKAQENDERLREARAEGYTQGLNESARRYEEAMTRAVLERREAAEAAYRKGFDAAVGQADKELAAAHQEGYRRGLKEAGQEFAAGGSVPAPLLDEARRQAYENGYEDGRSVGLSRGRRQAEAEQSAKLQEAAREAYREGFLDGKRTVADAERSWACGVLHLPPDAAGAEVKQHYKRLSMALHPDQNPQLPDVYIKNLNRARDLLDA